SSPGSDSRKLIILTQFTAYPPGPLRSPRRAKAAPVRCYIHVEQWSKVRFRSPPSCSAVRSCARGRQEGSSGDTGGGSPPPPVDGADFPRVRQASGSTRTRNHTMNRSILSLVVLGTALGATDVAAQAGGQESEYRG